MPTRIAHQRELSRRLYGGELPIVSGTNTSITTTIITDTTGALNYSSGDTNFYNGVYIYVVQASDAGSRGESRVTRGGWTVTGSLTIEPAISGLASGDLYILSKHSPTFLQDSINKALRTGTDGAVADLTSDTASQTALEDDIVIEGALYFIKREDDPGVAARHGINFREGVLQHGYSDLWIAEAGER